MGVQNFSLSIGPNYSTQGRTDGILIHEDMDGGYGVRDIRLVWSTEFGNDWNESWTIAISARGTIKGAPPVPAHGMTTGGRSPLRSATRTNPTAVRARGGTIA